MSKKPVPVDGVVGRNIRICRLRQGFSQAGLAERIGVSMQQVQKYESGTNRIGASRLKLIADALDVSFASLFEGSSAADRLRGDLLAGELIAKPHSLRLALAFDGLSSNPTRLAVLRLTEAIAKVQVPRSRHRRLRFRRGH
jgi:transcriptional regulator with XRE-family HTH domain